jgi:putative ABC transport system permease protein
MSILRDIFRRKGRSVLTISGIGIGVLALVVLGAVAENQNVYVSKLVGYYEDAVVVIEKDDANFVGMSAGNRPLSMKTMDQLRGQPGVRAVMPQVNVLLDTEYVSVIPPMVLGSDPNEGVDYASRFSLASGRLAQEGEHNVTVLGTDLAKQLKAGVGETVDLRGDTFEVIGIWDRTYVNLLDSAAFVSLAAAQQMYYDSLPKAFQGTVKPQDLVMQATVFAEPGVDSNVLAKELGRNVEGIRATGRDEMMKTVNSLIGLINAVLGTIAALALLVGGLSIVNTMTMAVTERTREIGVKRALGASRRRIAREVIAESAVMGALGGFGGLAIGAFIVVGLNSAMVATTGTTALIMTGRLAIGAIAFAVVVGTLGGLYPAWHASRLDPATALAYE